MRTDALKIRFRAHGIIIRARELIIHYKEIEI